MILYLYEGMMLNLSLSSSPFPQSCNEFIQKTKAELSEADSAASAKPQIKTPTSGSHKSRTKTSTPDRSDAVLVLVSSSIVILSVT